MNVINVECSKKQSIDNFSIRSYPIHRFESNVTQLASPQSFYEEEDLLTETNYEDTRMKTTSSPFNTFQDNSLSTPSNIVPVIGNKNDDKNKSKIFDRSYVINNVKYTQLSQILKRRSFGTQCDTFDNSRKILMNSYSYTKQNFHNETTNNTVIIPQVADHRKLSQSAVDDKKRAEKSTYCRPVIDYYDQAFVYETIQRNEILRKLVNKLSIAQKKEREAVVWNNFINYLKNKHKPVNDEIQPTEKYYMSELTEDFYSTRYKWRESNQRTKVLQDFYDHLYIEEPIYTYWPHSYDYKNIYNSSLRPQYLFNDNCSEANYYPISSHSRLIMLNRERELKRLEKANYVAKNYSRRRSFNNTLTVNTENKNRSKKDSKKFDAKNKLNMNLLHSSAVQTTQGIKESITCKTYNNRDEVNIGTLRNNYKNVSENVNGLNKRNEEFTNKSGNITLETIGAKLDTLIKSINTFIIEIHQKELLERNKNSVLVSCQSCNTNNINKTKSEIYAIVKHGPIVTEMLSNSSRSSTNPSQKTGRQSNSQYKYRSRPEIDETIIEEMDKSERLKNDIENTLKGNVKYPCTVQITVDIPTIERVIEVTASLSQAKIIETCATEDLEVTSENNSRNERRMTMAVNTDPLGLVALLKMTTETVKQLLSYMADIPYHAYFPTISLARHRNEESQFMCNICGATFSRPSLLRDHIHGHNLGVVRDCCVCRHIIDADSWKRRGLFKCGYCGHRFTRSYCCELHQQSCAQTAGRQHDVTSSHMILK